MNGWASSAQGYSKQCESNNYYYQGPHFSVTNFAKFCGAICATEFGKIQKKLELDINVVKTDNSAFFAENGK